MSDKRIDVHAHYFGGVVGRLFDSGFTLTGGYQMPPQWRASAAIEFMDRHDIATQILSVPWSFDDARVGALGPAAQFCRAANSELAGIVRDHPQRFGGFAAVPASDPEAALGEIAYALDVLGLDGVLLSSNARGHYFGQPSMEPILAELARRRVPVFVHPEECRHIEELGFGRPSSVIEFPLDTARNITNAIYSGVFQRFPALTLILAHCGGVLPMLGWRIAEHTEMKRGPHDAEIDPAHVASVLRGLYYDTALAGGPHALMPTLQVTDVDHVLFGSDWPAAPEKSIARNIANLTGFEHFTAEDLRRVERDNAVSLFARLATLSNHADPDARVDAVAATEGTH